MGGSAQATAPPDGLGALLREPSLRAVAAAYALGGAIVPSLGPVVASLVHELHLSGVAAALHGAFFGIGLLVLGLGPGRRVVHRAGPTRVLRACVGLEAAGAVVLASGHHVALTLLGAAAASTGLALLALAMPPVLRDHPRAGQHAFTDVNALYAVAAVVGPGSLALAASLGVSWRPALGALGVLGGAVALGLGGRVRLPAGRDVEGRATGLLGRPGVRLLALVLVLESATETAFLFWSAAFAHDVRLDSRLVATLVVGAFTAGQAAGRLWSRPVVGRVPDGLIVPLLFALAGAGALALLLGPGAGARLAGGLAGGLGTSLLYPVIMGRLFALAPDASVSVGALAALLSGASIAAAPLLLGALDDLAGLERAMALLPLLAAAGTAAALRAR